MSGKVAIIEPDMIQTGELAKNLSWKFQLKFMETIDELPHACETFHPDALLYGSDVPNLQTLHALISQRKRCCAAIPFIVAVNSNCIDCETYVREEGVFFYIVKPYDYTVLEEVFTYACKVSREAALKYQVKKMKNHYSSSNSMIVSE